MIKLPTLLNSTRKKSLGQGMTEYIIIVALIAVAAIAAFTFFGDVVRGQVSTMATELGGQEGKTGTALVKASGGKADAAGKHTDLANYAKDGGAAAAK